MVIELQKESLNINQIIGEKNITDIAEADCIVPDIKPDVQEIIETSGVINVYKREITEGKIRIDGSILVYIMYYGKNENNMEVRSINHTIDFSEILQIENATSEMMDETNVTLQNIECKIINERKISIKANVNYNVKIYSNKTENYVSNIDLKDMQKKEKETTVKTLLGIGETKTSVSEKITIEQNEQLAEILKATTYFSETETKVSYNKILTKSNLNLKLIYLSEDNKIQVIKKNFPIMGFVDMKDAKDDNVGNSKLEIKNMILKPGSSQDHTISVDFEIGIKVFAYENKKINIIDDMYSTSKNLNYTQKSLKAISDKCIYNGTYSFSQKQSIGITSERVIDIEPCITNKNISCEDGTVLVSGNINFAVLVANENYTGVKKNIVSSPFNYKIPAKNVTQTSQVSLNYYFANENYSVLQDGEIEFKVDINFTANVTNTSNIKLIENVEESKENLKKSNMVIYFTKSGDSLWSVGKKFHASTNSIKEANNLKDDKLNSNMQLYIV